MRNFKPVFISLVLAAAAIAGWWWHETGQPGSPRGRDAIRSAVAVTVPETLSAVAQAGKVLFDRSCAQCHGENAAGSDEGPPLVHKIYEPGHHSDQAFFLAARNGVRAHHWNFGNMLPIPEVKEPAVAAIIVYVRELQQANGIN